MVYPLSVIQIYNYDVKYLIMWLPSKNKTSIATERKLFSNFQQSRDFFQKRIKLQITHSVFRYIVKFKGVHVVPIKSHSLWITLYLFKGVCKGVFGNY